MFKSIKALKIIKQNTTLIFLIACLKLSEMQGKIKKEFGNISYPFFSLSFFSAFLQNLFPAAVSNISLHCLGDSRRITSRTSLLDWYYSGEVVKAYTSYKRQIHHASILKFNQFSKEKSNLLKISKLFSPRPK